jgi:hypothetical protein
MSERARMATGAGRPLRPRELQDVLNLHFYHPLAWRLARALAHTPITPNMISVAGAATVIAAGVAYAGPLWGWAWPGSAAAGLALHMTWHVLDGADGDLARLTGRTSPRGEMIDGLCDYSSHFVLYLLLGAVLAEQIGMVAWALAWPAGVAHAVQSNHVEVQRRFYMYWVHGKPWLNNKRLGGRGPFAWLVALYLRVGTGMSAQARLIDRAVTAADPVRRESLRTLIRAEWRPLLRLEKLLGPNQRAIALGLSMLLTRSPLAYFAYGGLWLSALLVVSVVLHDRVSRRIVARMATLG